MLHTYSLAKLSQALHNKEISSQELTQHYLDRITKAQYLNSFISTDAEDALRQARAADQRLHQKTATALTGIPLAHKDNFCTTNMATTCASKMLANFQAPYAATVVERLADAGTVLVGKTNMDEFAMGSSNEHSFFGPVRNPWNTNCIPGGSSGGSAAAVAARLVPFATGSDTGGSIRQPAALCGVSGLKPTYGLVSRFGLVSYASSLDQAGVIAVSAADIAMVLSQMAGFDEQDSTSLDMPIPDYVQALQEPLPALTIGLPTCFLHADVDNDIQRALSDAIAILKKIGATIIPVDLQLYPAWLGCYYTLANAEASSNLGRYDGIRFGHQSKRASSLRELVTQSRTEGFGSEVKRRILTGTYLLSGQQLDTVYVHGQKVRHMISLELQATLREVDLLLGPTTPSCAHPLQQEPHKQHHLSDIFTVVANLAGLPGISLPMGFSQGLPMGMQLLGPHFGETKLLQLAHAYQNATDWHTQIPPGFTV